MAKRQRPDRYDEFRRLTKDEQRERILSVTEKCIDGAPVFLARWVEIYLANDECPYDCGYCHPDE